MRRVTKVPSGPAFEAWRARAEEARAVTLRKPGTLDEEVWRDFREVFLHDAFDHKCAYCESDFSANFPTQTEHYRPKAQVTEGRIKVPGVRYYWLAHEWWNLLPSCHYCNTHHTDERSRNKHPGKLNEFRVRGSRVTAPSPDPESWRTELATEQPLLLNPYDDDPADHLTFETDTGIPMPLNGSERGSETISVCDLDRMSLCEKRRSAQASLLNWEKRIQEGETAEQVIPDSAEYSLYKRILLRRHIERRYS